MIAKLFAMSSQNAMIQNDPSEKNSLGFSYSKNMTNCEAILLETFSRNTNPYVTTFSKIQKVLSISNCTYF